jgi:hypothetical protein
MNWEALLVIGGGAIVLGAVLFLLARMLFYRPLSRSASGDQSPPVTRVGVLLISIFVIVYLGGYTMQYIAPESAFGRFVSHGYGRVAYFLALIAVFIPLERWLIRRELPLARSRDLPHDRG